MQRNIAAHNEAMENLVAPNSSGICGTLRCATIAYLRREWPTPIDLSNGSLHLNMADRPVEFVEVVQALVDDGLITVECIFTGDSNGPVALAATLTRKGALALPDIMMPLPMPPAPSNGPTSHVE